MICDGEELSEMLNEAHSAAQKEDEELFAKNSDPNRVFKGDVVFIQNQNTYSSAGMLITSAVDNKIGVVVGTPSAYRPSNYGDILAWQLPHTQINGFVSHKFFYRADRSKNDEQSILPSVEIPMSVDDFTQMRDVYWRWVVDAR